MKETCKDMTQENKEKYKEELKNQDKLKQEKIRLQNKEIRDKMKA